TSSDHSQGPAVCFTSVMIHSLGFGEGTGADSRHDFFDSRPRHRDHLLAFVRLVAFIERHSCDGELELANVVGLGVAAGRQRFLKGLDGGFAHSSISFRYWRGLAVAVAGNGGVAARLPAHETAAGFGLGADMA